MKNHEVASEVEKVKAFYDNAAHKYAQYQKSRYQKPSNFNDLLTWISISENLPAMKGAPILDAGSGPGGWSIRIAREGYKVHTADHPGREHRQRIAIHRCLGGAGIRGS